MKNKLFNLESKKVNEKGSVVYMFLVLFFIMSLFLIGIYSFVVSQSNRSSDGMSEINEFTKQSSLVESVKHNYSKDFFNDVSYGDMVTNLEGSSLGKSLKLPYSQYIYSYNKLDSDGNVATNKYYGKLDWLKFRYYDSVSEEALSDLYPELEDEVPSEEFDKRDKRLYKLKDNLLVGKDIDYNFIDSNNGNLLVRTPLYVKVNFSSDATRVYLIIKSSSGSKIYSFINRAGIDNIYKITDIPYSAYEILMYSEYGESLGSSSFSILKSREVDVEVFNKEYVGISYNKGSKVLGKTLKITLGRNENKIIFKDKELIKHSQAE